ASDSGDLGDRVLEDVGERGARERPDEDHQCGGHQRDENPTGYVASVVCESRLQAPATRRHAGKRGTGQRGRAELMHRAQKPSSSTSVAGKRANTIVTGRMRYTSGTSIATSLRPAASRSS